MTFACRLAGFAPAKNIAYAHGAAGYSAAEAACAAKAPGKAGTHGECVVGHIKLKVFTNRVNYGLGAGEAVVEYIHRVFPELLKANRLYHGIEPPESLSYRLIIQLCVGFNNLTFQAAAQRIKAAFHGLYAG